MAGVWESVLGAEDESDVGPAGLRVLSANQKIRFVQYIRKVLPLDGYVFWMRTQQVWVQGSLHITTDKQQREDETAATNKVVFTTGEEIQHFETTGPDTIWIGCFGGNKFAFRLLDAYYGATNLFHYLGDAINPSMETQLVDVGDEFPNTTLIVSNSLPAWLQLVNYKPVWLAPYNPGITLYPSFAVPDNLAPPYGAVHIIPGQTKALQAVPLLDKFSTHTQLVQDSVRITLYGLTNDQALDFVDLIYQYSSDTDAIGIMNMPVIQDEKRTYTELSILAMKKTLELDVSYYQTRQNDIAKQLINEALVDYPVHAGLFDDNGALIITDHTHFPQSPYQLAPGSFWDNAGPLSITSYDTPEVPDLIYFEYLSAAELAAIGTANLPLERQLAGSGILWNDGGSVFIS